MRLHRAFRPAISDLLEDRVVLSQGGASAPVQVFLVEMIPLPVSVQARADVQLAFVTFVTRYNADISSVLLAPAADGTVNPAANLPAFRSAVATDLQSLSRDLTTALAKSPATASFIPAVQASITGNGPGSLQSQLGLIATTLGVQSTSVPVFAMSSAQAVQEAANQVMAQTLAPGRPRIIQADTVDAFPVSNDLQVSLVTPATPRLKQAFDEFLKNYASAVNSLLLAPPGNLQASRDTFHTQVNTALGQLDSQVAQILRDLHATSPQVSQAHQTLIGAGPTSLKNALTALPSPTTGSAPSSAILQVLSSKLIANALSQVSGIVSSLVPGLN